MTKLTLTALRPTLATGICTLCLLSATGVAGEQPHSTCDALPGTYVATATDREGVFASRTLMTFTADGALLVTDAGQSGAPQPFNPISSSQGVWHCVTSTPEGLEIEAIAVNFTLADQDGLQTIGRLNYELKLNAARADLTGTAELFVAVSTDLESAEPVTDPGELIETFGIDAVKLPLP